MLNSSRENETILDCFMGSGTTGIAVINAGIKFHLVEDHLVAYAPKNNYEFGIIKDKDEKKYYWYLTPYNKSIFMTAVENGIEMVFFAIKENEELYS